MPTGRREKRGSQHTADANSTADDRDEYTPQVATDENFIGDGPASAHRRYTARTARDSSCQSRRDEKGPDESHRVPENTKLRRLEPLVVAIKHRGLHSWPVALGPPWQAP